MNKKYIFVDIDGTILDHSYGDIRPKTKQALKILNDLGHDIYLCTGRNLPTSLFDLGFKPKAYVLSSGALVCDEKNVYYENPFPESLIDSMIELGKKCNIDVNLETKIYNYACQWVLDLVEKHFDSLTKKYWIPFENYNQETVYKVMIKGHNKEGYDRFVNEFKNLLSFNNTFGIDFYDEVQLNENSKGHAIKMLAKQGLIKIKDTIVVGDSLNDLSMFEIGAFSIAMGNAVNQLKQKADFITDDIDKEGFYNAFDKLKMLKNN